MNTMNRVFCMVSGALLCLPGSAALAQKKVLDNAVYDSWRQVTAPKISDDGRWVAYTLNPARGDGQVVVYDAATQGTDTLPRAMDAVFAGRASAPWLAARVKPTREQVRMSKMPKSRMKPLPKDTLLIYPLGGSARPEVRVPGLKSFKAADRGSVLAYLYEVAPAKDTADKKAKVPKKFDRLVVWDLAAGDSMVVDSVAGYALARNGEMVVYSVKEADSAVSVWALRGGVHTRLYAASAGRAGSLAADEQGRQGAYLVTPDTTATGARYELYYFDAKDMKPVRVAASVAGNGYVASQFGDLKFSREGSRLEFGMAPPPRVVPTDTLPSDEKTAVDLWSYTDTLLMTQQLATAKKIKETAYTAAYYPASGRWAQLEDRNLARVVFAGNEAARYALGTDEWPYTWASTWESPGTKDLYAVDVRTGERRMVVKGAKAQAYISPSGKYVVWYDGSASEWKAVATSAKNGGEVSLSKAIPYGMGVLNFDMPDDTPAEGLAGWTADDRAIVYDNFDLWLTDPSGRRAPVCLTQGAGRRDSVALRYVRQDPEERVIDLSQPLLLSAFDRGSRDGGFYRLPAGGGAPERLVMDGHKYTFVAKARETDKVLWQRENFRDYRDLWRSDLSFAVAERVSEANPQAADYKWGSVRRVAWEDMNGEPAEGLLYLPENYDSTRRYPVIVYFYERHTDDMHKHVHPQPSWSIVIPAVCTSQDYVVFMPDIKYRTGYPGQSCYDAVVSGAKMLIDRGIADPRRMGLQGQSWGGYQIAYLVTRTDMFRCASAGAPVSNMTSAAGGIRWGTGLPRMFQYEHGQSRIGGSLWEKPMEYIENSPLFFANKVRTPMLMRHDDADEAVPWYQGIEYFLALRRYGVPVWMLNYNGEPHNLKGYASRLDWDARMMGFFDHYLKDAPMPRWMREGIPVKDKGVDPKLDL